jgi:hypothetical protein
MHREKNLFPRVVAFDNLHRAFLGASHGKRDRPALRELEYHLETRRWEIRRALEAGTYEWGVFRRFWVSDPKRREIRAAPFRDRVVHHAIFDVLAPILRRGFIADSYACIPGRGTHRAVQRYRGFVRARAGHGYRVQCDIKRYFALLASDRGEARDRLSTVRSFLNQRLRLELNPRRVVIAPLLGYVQLGDGRLRVRRRSVRRLWRRLPVLQRRVSAAATERETARASLASWFGLAKHAHAFRLSRSIFRQRDVDHLGKRLLVKSLYANR